MICHNIAWLNDVVKRFSICDSAFISTFRPLIKPMLADHPHLPNGSDPDTGHLNALAKCYIKREYGANK